MLRYAVLEQARISCSRKGQDIAPVGDVQEIVIVFKDVEGGGGEGGGGGNYDDE